MLKVLIKKIVRNIFLPDSYSQIGEDLIVNYLFKQKIKAKTFRYLEIGSNDPIKLNNTYKFYKQGCKGILIEANSALIKRLQQIRPLDNILNIGIGFNKGDEVSDFYILTSHELSTFSQKLAINITNTPEIYGVQKIESIQKIKMIHINSILDEYFYASPLDFLSIDAEGLDYLILKDLNFQKYKPTCLCIEMSNLNKQQHQELEQLLKTNGYHVYESNELNYIYVQKNHLLSLRNKYPLGLKLQFKIACKTLTW